MTDSDQTKPKKSNTATAKLTFAALVIALAVLAIALVTTDGGGDDTPAASEIASKEFTLDSGETATLASFDGEPLVVNFFASWCAPCRAELPDFEAVHQDTKQVVTFLGINHDSNEQSWKGFVQETDISFQTAFQPNQEIWSELDALSLPSTAFISADGTVEHFHSGVLTEEQLRELIDTHLVESES